jgi:hypothetical protein
MKGARLLMVGIAALAPVAVLGEAAEIADPEGAFAVPERPLVLTRTWRRALPGGKEVVSRRSYAIRFRRDGDGYLVDGELVASEIDAPPALRAYAEIERTRSDAGLFPIRLDRQGRILPGDARIRPASPARIEGAAVTSERIAQSPLSEAEKAQALGLVQQVLDRGGAATSWPSDLFHPLPGASKVTKQVSLPGGSSGAVTVSTEARLTHGGGFLDRMDRVVQTDLGGDRRVVRETWTLEALPPSR